MTRILWTCLLSLGLAPGPLIAQEVIMLPFDGSFDDAAFAVETAIVGRGLVIDFVSHVGDMLARTGADVGSDVEIFVEADVFLFCSAVVSRQVMEVDPSNIAWCPYSIFVTERENEVAIGFRTMPDGPLDIVEELLFSIATEAAGS